MWFKKQKRLCEEKHIKLSTGEAGNNLCRLVCYGSNFISTGEKTREWRSWRDRMELNSQSLNWTWAPRRRKPRPGANRPGQLWHHGTASRPGCPRVRQRGRPALCTDLHLSWDWCLFSIVSNWLLLAYKKGFLFLHVHCAFNYCTELSQSLM